MNIRPLAANRCRRPLSALLIFDHRCAKPRQRQVLTVPNWEIPLSVTVGVLNPMRNLRSLSQEVWWDNGFRVAFAG